VLIAHHAKSETGDRGFVVDMEGFGYLVAKRR
jgi:hypothetical protein